MPFYSLSETYPRQIPAHKQLLNKQQSIEGPEISLEHWIRFVSAKTTSIIHDFQRTKYGAANPPNQDFSVSIRRFAEFSRRSGCLLKDDQVVMTMSFNYYDFSVGRLIDDNRLFSDYSGEGRALYGAGFSQGH